MLKKFLSLLAVVVMGVGFLSGCVGTSSESSLVSTIHVDDQNIMVSDVIEPEVTFTPTTAIDSYTFTAPDETVVTIQNHFITAIAAGEVTVTCETNNTHVSTTFLIAVTAPVVSTTVPDFNEAGTFENGLAAWTLSGPTASVATTEGDTDRAQEDMQLKLYTGAAIDFTISYTLADLPVGTYTFSFEIAAGNMTTILCTIDGVEYSWIGGTIFLGVGTYRMNYFLLELTEAKDVSFSMYFLAGEADAGWGYVDNIKIEEGDTRPTVETSPKDYVVDGSFESGALTNWALSGTCGGTLRVYTNNPVTGSKNLDFWGNDITGDNFTLSQSITNIDAGSNYTATVKLVNGDDNAAQLIDSFFYVTQGAVTQQVAITMRGWTAGIIEYTISGLSLTADPVEIGVHFQPGSGKYWMQLDDIKLLNNDILV